MSYLIATIVTLMALPPGIDKMPPGLFVECEDMSIGGEWEFQKVKVMGWSGRGYVVDTTVPEIARSVVEKQLTLPRAGKYHVWVHAYVGHRNKPEGCDRRLVVEVNGALLDTTHEALTGNRFTWELAGAVVVGEDCRVHVRIHDRGRSWAIVDCLLLTDDLKFRPEGWTGNSRRESRIDKTITAKTFSLPPAKPATYPKASKEHVEEISAAKRTYEIEMGGRLDEFNTAAYFETYSGFMRMESKFEPNEYVAIENVGDCDVVAPRVVVNGRRNWHSADEILQGILEPGMTEAEKAMAIWKFTSSIEVQCHDNNKRVGPPFPDDRSHPSRNGFKERGDPVKAANCYYCSGCSLSAANFVVLCRRAGLTARAIWICDQRKYSTHCVAEAWHDDGWHLYDPENALFFLAEDNTTVASYRQVHENFDLVKRTRYAGFSNKEQRDLKIRYDQHYPPRGMPVEDWVSTMDMTLRPHEKFVWRWDNVGKFRCGDNTRNRGYEPYRLANGRMVYRPDLSKNLWRRGAVGERNIQSAAEDGGTPCIRPALAGAPATVVFKVANPYPIVGGVVGGRFVRKTDRGSCRIYVSVANSDWVCVWSAEETGELACYLATDEVLDPKPTKACREYYVKYELVAEDAPGDVGLNEVYIETDVQMASTSLPALTVGSNTVAYWDRSAPGRRVQITHGWCESTETTPPLPPTGPTFPLNGGEVKLEELRALKWQAASDPDGKPIADYHIQVSPRADMLHPVSPNFDRLTFSGEPEWPVPEGWLVKGRDYFWRVRARDEWGAWSGWSDVWRFAVGAH